MVPKIDTYKCQEGMTKLKFSLDNQITFYSRIKLSFICCFGIFQFSAIFLELNIFGYQMQTFKDMFVKKVSKP